MKARFPESQEEKAVRIAETAARMAAPRSDTLEAAGEPTLAPPDVLETRIAQRFVQSDPQMAPDVAAALAAGKARDGRATANKLANGEIKPQDLSKDSIANLEAVIRVSDRPAWFVHENFPAIEPGDRNNEFWISRVALERKKMKSVCSAVGCVMKQQDEVRAAIGTGWLVATDTLVTNAHVAQHLVLRKPGAAPDDARGGFRLRPDTSGRVDFLFEHDGPRSNVTVRISEVLYVETATDPDIAVFRLDFAGAIAPAPICLDLVTHRDAGWPDTYVFVVGHPVVDLQDDNNVKAVFGKLDGSKRCSPGQVMKLLGKSAIAHDCSTTNGSSGSPLVDFASYQVVGLHYFGKPGQRNEAVFMPAVANHPAIVKSRSQNWGI